MTAQSRDRRYRGMQWGLMAAALLILSPADLRAQQADAEPPSQAAEEAVPEGEPSQISDWALAGVLWSDAHLVRRVAAAAASEANSQPQRQRMRQLQQECDAFIDALRTFGWQRVRSGAARDEATASSQQRGLPKPEQVGQQLEQQFGDSDREEGSGRDEVETDVAPPGTLDRRVTSETPPGRNDPGVDDELEPRVQWFDLSHYRVDDFIDETPAEETSRADAIEDGVEGAIAAGIGTSPSGFDRTGRISPRELQTRSPTLPVTGDTIYDTDDYDPNLDYQAEQPEAGRTAAGAYELESGAVPDYDAPLDERLDDPRAIDDENEAVRALTEDSESALGEEIARERAEGLAEQVVDETGDDAASERAVAERLRSPGEQLSRYTGDADKHRADARWVQFHLEANQRRWDMITDEAGPQQRLTHLRAAIVQLTADAQTVRALTDHPDLIRILERIAGM